MSSPSTAAIIRPPSTPRLVSKDPGKSISTPTTSKGDSSHQGLLVGDISFRSLLIPGKSPLGNKGVVSLKSNATENAIGVARAMLINNAHHVNRMRFLRDSRNNEARKCKETQHRDQEMMSIQFTQHDAHDRVKRSQKACVVAMLNKRSKEESERRDSMLKESRRENDENEKELRRTILQEKDKVGTNVRRRQREMLFAKQERIRLQNEVRQRTHEKLHSSHLNERSHGQLEHHSELNNYKEITAVDKRRRLEEAERREFFAEKHEREIKVEETARRLEEERILALLEKQERSDQKSTNKFRQEHRLKEKRLVKNGVLTDACLVTARHNRQDMEAIREQQIIENGESDRLSAQDRHFRKVYADRVRREDADVKDELRRSTAKRAGRNLQLKHDGMLEAQLSKMAVSEKHRLKLSNEMRRVGLGDSGK